MFKACLKTRNADSADLKMRTNQIAAFVIFNESRPTDFWP